MPYHDSYHHIEAVPVIAPVVVTDDTAQVGAIIDNQDCDALTYVIETGTIADADVTFAVLLQEGNQANLSDAATVADTDTINTQAGAAFNFASDNVCIKLGYIGTKRYTRLTITPANNTGNAPLAAVAIKSRLQFEPAA